MKVLWLLLALSGTALAQDGWVELTRTGKAIVYAPASGRLLVPNGKPAVWVYLDYFKPEPNGALSTRAYVEADCGGMKARMLSVTDHSGPRGGGRQITPPKTTEWEPLPPETALARAWMLACTGK